MRVLVTGGAGFTGRALVQQLTAAGHDVVIGSSRGAGTLPGPGDLPAGAAQVVPLDVRDRAQVGAVVAQGFDVVCHLAALTQARASFADPLGYFDVNATGTAHVLHALDEQARATGEPGRLVFTSTGAVYGPCQGVIAEDHPTLPTSPYGTSKLAAERLIAHQAATGRLSAVTLRSFNIAGAVGATTDPDTTRIIPKALAVAAGRFDRVQVNGDGATLREYTHVLDVADALAAAVDAVPTSTGHRVYNLGSGHPVSLAELLDIVRQVTGRPIPVEHQPAQPEPQVLVADSSRIRAELGWVPRRSNLEQIIADAWDAWEAVARPDDTGTTVSRP